MRTNFRNKIQLWVDSEKSFDAYRRNIKLSEKWSGEGMGRF